MSNMEHKYNMRSPAVKRLMREASELKDPTEDYFAQPLEDNLFEWHFTVRGPIDSEFEGGIYHGRILLPPEYPMRPPSIILLTPNGRFETCKKICLSISGHHPESWQPSWSIRTALLAIIGFMPTRGLGTIGSLDYSPEERRSLARRSNEWKCTVCGPIRNFLLNPGWIPRKINQEARDIAAQISFTGETPTSDSQQTGKAIPLKTDQPIPESITNYEHNNETMAVPAIEPEVAVRRSTEETNPIPQNPTVTDSQNVVIENSGGSLSTIIVVALLVAIVSLLIRRLFLL